MTLVESNVGSLAANKHKLQHNEIAKLLNSQFVNVKNPDFGAKGDGVTDDTTAIQAAITLAFNSPGGTVYFPPGTYIVSSTLVTPADTAGAVRLIGGGRAKGLSGADSGDPLANQGASIVYTGTTGDIFQASVSTGNKRQYITIENLYFKGNKASGTSGHGIHFLANATTVAVLFCLRDVTVTDVKQHGIFADGNVFESQLFNVRSSHNGDRGFKATNNVGLPGQIEFVGFTAQGNTGVGVDLSGGGGFSFLGLHCIVNSAEGLTVNGANFYGVDLTLEGNGTAAGNQATFTAGSVHLLGVGITALVGGTGNGLSFVTAIGHHVYRLFSNSSVAGVGYKDFRFANDCSRCSVDDYDSDDSTARYAIGTGTGHLVRRAGQWLEGTLLFGTDTNLYRTDANVLRTDDAFRVSTVTEVSENAANAYFSANADPSSGAFKRVLARNAASVISQEANSDIGFFVATDAGATVGSAITFTERMYLETAGRLRLPTVGAGGGLIVGGDTNLYRSAADMLSTDDDLRIATAGKGLRVAEGANAKMGTAVLVAGAVTVSTTAVTANSRILLTSQIDGGTVGFLRVSTRTAGTSFTITSSSGTDTSTVAWMILEPA